MSKFDYEEQEILRLFQTEENRHSEEEFSQIFTENSNVRLAFINEDRAFTDGRNIVVDPAADKLFIDTEALEGSARFLNVPEEKISAYTSPWAGLKMSARSQNIHECLHIIYTHFPPYAIADRRSTGKARRTALSLISNIIEDAYIEAVGAEVYDNAEFFLKWGRVSRLLAKFQSEGTVQRSFDFVHTADTNTEKLMFILDYMTGVLLYPMAKPMPMLDCEEKINRVKPLFMKGAAAASPKERHSFACMIFDELEELIPDDDTELDTQRLDDLLGGMRTHLNYGGSNGFCSEGREQSVSRLLFTDLNGVPIAGSELSEQAVRLAAVMTEEFKRACEGAQLATVSLSFNYSDLGASCIHKGITVHENHPLPDPNCSRAYSNIVKKYKTSINKANARFGQLIHTETEIIEYKQLYGNGISSKHFGDPKKRYWYSKKTVDDVPELTVLFMIDGSGSMRGERRNAARASAVILHEVLKRQPVRHAFVEHRAVFGKPCVEHNVLVDFDGKRNEGLNLMRISADEGTREGLSLMWAEKYISEHSDDGKRLIIVISDGVPMHECDNNYYYPPISIRDTANAANKIIRRGTKIIAIALGGKSESCYEELSAIYPETVDCTDLGRLTEQLLRVISRQLK